MSFHQDTCHEDRSRCDCTDQLAVKSYNSMTQAMYPGQGQVEGPVSSNLHQDCSKSATSIKKHNILMDVDPASITRTVHDCAAKRAAIASPVVLPPAMMKS